MGKSDSGLTRYRLPFLSIPFQTKEPRDADLLPLEKIRTMYAINILAGKGAIAQRSPCNRQFLSPYFLREKPNDDDRFILNLKEMNKSIEPPHFKLEEIKTAIGSINRGCFMMSIDLKDAYLLIPIAS